MRRCQAGRGVQGRVRGPPGPTRRLDGRQVGRDVQFQGQGGRAAGAFQS